MAGDGTHELGSGTTSEYGCSFKYLGEPWLGLRRPPCAGEFLQCYLREITAKVVAQSMNAAMKRTVGDADGTSAGVMGRSRQACASQSAPSVQSRSV